jgi:diphthine-ammonia ligase
MTSNTKPPATVRAAISWSGGKDSCLALMRASESGYRIDTLLTMLDVGGLSKSHALPGELIAAQAEAIGVAWCAHEADMAHYATVFDAALAALRSQGHTHMVFGDIDLQAHRDWLEPACRAAQLDPVFPLWGMQRRAVADEIISRKVRAQIVCVDTRWLDASFCGASYDDALLARLPVGVCPCGENGEFHTFVSDAPCFRYPLRLTGGVPRRVRSAPPLADTELILQTPRLAGAAS